MYFFNNNVLSCMCRHHRTDRLSASRKKRGAPSKGGSIPLRRESEDRPLQHMCTRPTAEETTCTWHRQVISIILYYSAYNTRYVQQPTRYICLPACSHCVGFDPGYFFFSVVFFHRSYYGNASPPRAASPS